MTSKAITIQDIARIAGVSKATVSRVLNHKPDVDPATRERILRIIDEQGFTPDIVATIQGGGRSRFVGVLAPSLLRFPLIPEILRGVAEIIESTTYELIMYSIAHSEERSTAIDQILSRKKKLISGLLAMLPGQTAYHLDELYDEGFPLVMIDDQIPPLKMPWVGVDNRQAAALAVQHLIQLGHQRIGIIQGPSSYLVSHERYLGYCDALAAAGLPLDPALAVRGDFEPPGGYACARELFALADRPTAIFSSNDHMAYGVLDAAKEMGVRIPEDVALVGFDDNSMSAHVHPPLTTVHQPFYEMGKEGISLLLSLIESAAMEPAIRPTFARPAKPDPVRIYLPTTLVIRASSGAPISR
jgi:LacI family transcriptional regulator